MSHPWAFPPDHQSFAKGTLSLQEHKNTQGVTQSLVIQSNLNYKKNNLLIQRITQGHQDHRLQERARVHL